MTLQRDPRAGGGRPDSPPPTLDRIWRIRAFSPPTPEPPRRARDGGRATAATRSGACRDTRRACGGRRDPRQSRRGWRGRRGRRPTPEPPSGAREGGVGDPRQSRRSGRGRCRRATDARAAAPGEETAAGDRRQRARRASGGGWWRRAPEAAAAVEGVAGVPGKEGGATTATRGEGRRAGGDR